MLLKWITMANFIVIQYLVTTHYQVPYKWPLLVLTAAILAYFLVRKQGPPKD